MGQGQLVLPSLHPLVEYLNQALGCLVQPLLVPPDLGGRVGQLEPVALGVQFPVDLFQAKAEETMEPPQESQALLFERSRVRACLLRCRSRGGRPDIGSEVGQGGVGLVADSGNQRNRAGGDRPHNRLVVESQEVFEAAASPRQDQDVAPVIPGSEGKGLDQRGRSLFSLDS